MLVRHISTRGFFFILVSFLYDCLCPVLFSPTEWKNKNNGIKIIKFVFTYLETFKSCNTAICGKLLIAK